MKIFNLIHVLVTCTSHISCFSTHDRVKRSALVVEWFKALPLTVCCLSQLFGFESSSRPVRYWPVI